MKHRLSNISVLFVLALFACAGAFAQNNAMPPGVVWRKQVARELDFGAIKNKKDSTLVKMIVGAIRVGKVHPYSNYDHNFTFNLVGDEITDIIGTKTITVTSIDPKTGKEEVIKRKVEPEYLSVHKYRILEEWTFNRQTGTTEITTMGIAPLLEVFGDDGDFRGIKPLFWVKYQELAGVIVDDEKINKGRSLTTHIWTDYFAQAGNLPASKSAWSATASRIFDIDPEDSKTSRLKEMSSDTSLYDQIYYEFEKMKIIVYDSIGKSIALQQLLGKADTVYLEDLENVITGQKVMKIIKRTLTYGNEPKYKLIENWSFDRFAGITRIKIDQIAPALPEKDINDNPTAYHEIFRLKFADFSGMLEKFEQSHYNHSLANLLWKDYFQTPAQVKKEK